MEPRSAPASGQPADARLPRRYLSSWKEIAAYFARDVRTVRRWERREALPVHRHHHGARDSVYAFEDELDRWLQQRMPRADGRGNRLRSSRAVLALTLTLSAVTLSTAGFLVYRQVLATSGASSARQDAGQRGANQGHPSMNGDVRATFLVARHQLQRRAGFRKEARDRLETVTRRVPDFAEAQALLGEAYLRQALFDSLDDTQRAETWAKAEAAVRRALELDADVSSGHTVLSRILLLRDWDWRRADEESLRAIALDPSSPDAQTARALFLRSAGRVAEAVEHRERAQRADPLNPQWLVFLADEWQFARRFEVAATTYQRALELERDYRAAVVSLADVWTRLGRPDTAADWQIRFYRLVGADDIAAGFDAVRSRDGAGAALAWCDRQNLARFQRARERHLWDLAYTHARLGEREPAIHYLELAYERRDPGLLQARVDPDLDSLRGDPRFDDLLKRIGPN